MVTTQNFALELSAVIVRTDQNTPCVIVAKGNALPSGPLETQHKKLEQALRSWVTEQSGLTLGYVEQLYTFADKDRGTTGPRTISIGYLALSRNAGEMESALINSINWYTFFPWEDHREGSPKAILSLIHKGLIHWKNTASDTASRRAREDRITNCFPKNPREWNEELVLQRYELLWEAGLIDESRRPSPSGIKAPGLSMQHDHRRILATAIARLRSKIKYRPVVFELLPDRFTLLELQTTVEALAGLRVHKQNFRRLVLGQGLVEETSKQASNTRGRPAKLFAFRNEIVRQRATAGTKLPRTN
jgi:hypothetical protein